MTLGSADRPHTTQPVKLQRKDLQPGLRAPPTDQGPIRLSVHLVSLLGPSMSLGEGPGGRPEGAGAKGRAVCDLPSAGALCVY